MNVNIVNQYFAEGYFAEEVFADGPWEARFIFCGKYGVNPRDVKVSPEIRTKGGSYWCNVGEMKKGFVYVNAQFRRLDHFGRSLGNSAVDDGNENR
jgi:hypothetical protein